MSTRELGPFFEVTEWSAVPAEWRHLGADLATEDVRTAWSERARSRYAARIDVPHDAVDARAMRSVLHLGMCARITSPWIARRLLGGDAFVPTTSQLRWVDDDTTMFPLGVVGAHEPTHHGDETGRPPLDCGATSPLVAAFSRDLFTRLLEPLAASRLVTSRAIAWGNVVSAVHGGVSAVVRRSPDVLLEGQVLVEDVVRLAPVRGVAWGAPVTPSFRRGSCCLVHRLPGGSRQAVCGDCVLRERTDAARG